MLNHTSMSTRNGGLLDNKLIYHDGRVDHTAMRIRIAHGVIMSVVFLCLKPTGAILLRVVKKNGFRTHVVWQMFAWCLAFAGVGLGVWLAGVMHRFSKQHVIIGLIVASLMFIQPFLGEIHHLVFLKVRHRTIWGHFHVWLGRLVMTLGIINGGIGLGDADNSKAWIIVYSVIGGMTFLVYIGVQMMLEHEKRKEKKNKGASIDLLADSSISEERGHEELRPIRRESAEEAASPQNLSSR